MKKIVERSFGVTYVTENFLQNRYPTFATITEYASNVQIPVNDTFAKDVHIEALKNSSKNSILKLGIIGNLNVKYKGFDVALKALKELKDTSPEIRFKFLLVGGGDQTYIRSLIEEFGLKEECEIIGRLT